MIFIISPFRAKLVSRSVFSIFSSFFFFSIFARFFLGQFYWLRKIHFCRVEFFLVDFVHYFSIFSSFFRFSSIFLSLFVTLFRRKSEFPPPHCRYESIGAIFMAVGPLFRRFLDSGRLDHP